MSVTAKVWSIVMLWLALGLMTTNVAHRQNPAWFYPCIRNYYGDCVAPDTANRSTYMAVMSTVAWPVTVLAILGNAAVR